MAHNRTGDCALAILLAGCLAACGLPNPSGPVAEPGVAPPLSSPPAGLIVAVGDKPEGIAFDPLTGILAVGVRSPDAVLFLDRDGHLLQRVDVSAAPRHLSFAGPGGPLLVPAERSGDLDVVALPSGDIIARVRVGRQPHDALQADGRYFVTNEFSNTISVVQGADVIATLSGPTQPGGIAAGAGFVGVLGVRSHLLEVFDPGSLHELATAPAGDGPTHLVAYGDALYVADTGGSAIILFNALPVLARVARVPVPGRPYGIALDPVRKRLWVTLTATNSLAEFAVGPTPPTRVASFATVRQPNSVAVDPSTGRVFVTGTGAGSLQILDPPDAS